MKYVHLFDGTEHEAPEGGLNWPWVPADRLEAAEDHARVRAAARAHVGERVAAARAEAAEKRGPGRPRKAAPEEGSPDA